MEKTDGRRNRDKMRKEKTEKTEREKREGQKLSSLTPLGRSDSEQVNLRTKTQPHFMGTTPTNSRITFTVC